MTLSRRQLAAFAMPALPLTGMYFPVFVFLGPFYAQTMGLSLTAIGTVFLLIRLFDAISDPAMGWISDRVETAWGRRRIWMVAGMPLVMLAVWKLFVPTSAGIGPFSLWLLLLTAGWTMMLTPYFAWAAELSGDYEERSRIAIWRDATGLLGTILAAVLFGLGATQGIGMQNAALMVVVGLPVSVVLCLWLVPEPKNHSRKRAPVLALFGVMRGEPRFSRLLLAYLFNGAANALPASLFLFFVSARLQSEDWGPALLILYFGAGVLAALLWSWLIRKYAKNRIWCSAMVYACAVFACTLLLGPGDVVAFAVICVLSGAALGADLSLPSAILADLVDIDTAQSGEQRTGAFFALWSLVTKASLAIAGGAAFIILEQGIGFDADGINSEEAIFGLALLYALAPIILKLIAVGLMWNFDLSREEQARLRAQIETAQP